MGASDARTVIAGARGLRDALAIQHFQRFRRVGNVQDQQALLRVRGRGAVGRVPSRGAL